MSSTVRRSSRPRSAISLNEDFLSRRTAAVAAAESFEEEGDEAEDSPPQSPVNERKRGRPKGSKSIKSTVASAESGRRRSSSRDEKESPQDAEGDEDFILPEDLSDLYKSLSRTSGAVKTIANNWVRAYERKNGEDSAKTDLVNFLLQSSGSVAALSEEDATEGDLTELIAHVSSSELVVHPDPPIKRNKKFGVRFKDFWHKLVNELKNDKLYDNVLIEFLFGWLAALAKADVRMMRQSAVSAVVELTKALIDVANEVQQEIQTKETQLKQIGSKSSEPLKRAKAELERHLDLLHGFLQSACEIFYQRYRDVCPLIRTQCISALGWWIRSYPAYFLSDNFLKYIGWMLSDKELGVRKAAVNAVLELYREADAETVAKLELFTQRFLKRFSDMCQDVEAPVAALAIELMTCLLKCGILTEQQGEQIPPEIWDEDSAISEAAINFVYEDTFAETEDNGAAADADDSPTKNTEDLMQLLNIFDKYCPLAEQSRDSLQQPSAATSREDSFQAETTVGHYSLLDNSNLIGPMETLIDGFWDRLKCLRDWNAITAPLLAAESEAETRKSAKRRSTEESEEVAEARQLTLLFLLLAVTKKVSALAASESGAEEDREAARSDFDSLTTHLLGVMPRLMTIFQSDARKSSIVIQLPQFVQLEFYVNLRKKKEFQDLLRAMKSVYLKHLDQNFLVQAGISFGKLADPAFEFSDLTMGSLNEIYHEISRAINSATGEELAVQDREKSRTLIHALKRLLAIARPIHLPQFQWGARLEDALKLYSLNLDTEDNQVLVSLLFDLCWTELIWLVAALDHAAPEPAAIKKISALQHALLTRLEFGLQSDSVLVRDTAFKIVTDVFTSFGVKLSGTPEAELAIPNVRLGSLQRAYQKHFVDLMKGADLSQRIAARRGQKVNKDDAEALLLEVRRKAVFIAVKPVLFDIRMGSNTLRHIDLAGALFSFFHFYEDESIDLILKQALTDLRKASPILLLQAQMAALKYAFEHDHDFSQDKLLALSSKLLHLHPINPAQRSFIGFLKSGVKYAVADPPTFLPFLDLLVPWVQRASVDDVVSVTKEFQIQSRLAVEHRLPSHKRSDWEPLNRFAASLLKKGGKRALNAANEAAAQGKSDSRSISSRRSVASDADQSLNLSATKDRDAISLTPSTGGRARARLDSTPSTSVSKAGSLFESGLSPVKESAKKRGVESQDEDENEQLEEEEEVRPKKKTRAASPAGRRR